MKENIMGHQELPRTDSIQELVRFWDTHDLTDFEAELEETADPVFERTTAVTLHLGSVEAETLERIAESKGVTNVDLIRRWVLEKISRP